MAGKRIDVGVGPILPGLVYFLYSSQWRRIFHFPEKSVRQIASHTEGDRRLIQSVILRRILVSCAFKLSHGQLWELAAEHCMFGARW